MDSDDETYEWSGIWAALRRRAGVIIGITALVAAVALVVSLLQDDRYEATSTLLFRDPGLDERIFDPPILFGGDGVLGGQNLLNSETTIGLVSVDSVAERAAEELGKSPGQVEDEIEIREGAGRELIEATATTGDPAESASTANAYAAAFLAERRERDAEVYGRALRSVEQRLSALPPELRASSEGQRLRRQLRQLEALAVMQTGDAELVEEAEAPTARSAPKPLRNTALAAATGLILGLLAALLLERFDRRLRTRRDFERAYGALVLAEPGDVRAANVWARIRFREQGPPLALLVAGARGEAGADTLARGLTEAATGEGSEVVLLSGPEALGRIGDGREAGRLTVVAGPPLSDAAAAIPLITACGAVLVVAAVEQPLEEAASARREIERLGAELVGVVISGD